jgi:hypothetical protein
MTVLYPYAHQLAFWIVVAFCRYLDVCEMYFLKTGFSIFKVES